MTAATTSGGSDAAWSALFRGPNRVAGTRRARFEMTGERAAGVRREHDRNERHRRRRNGPFQYRHLEDQCTYPFRTAATPRTGSHWLRATGRRVLPCPHPVVEQREHLRRIGVNPVRGGMYRLVTATMAEQVEQNDTSSPLGKRAGDTAVQLRIQQEPVRVYEQTIALAIYVVESWPSMNKAFGSVLLGSHGNSLPVPMVHEHPGNRRAGPKVRRSKLRWFLNWSSPRPTFPVPRGQGVRPSARARVTRAVTRARRSGSGVRDRGGEAATDHVDGDAGVGAPCRVDGKRARIATRTHPTAHDFLVEGQRRDGKCFVGRPLAAGQRRAVRRPTPCRSRRARRAALQNWRKPP